MANSIYDEKFFTDEEKKNAEAIRQAAQRGETDWDSAHELVEAYRANHGYSGGQDGSRYERFPGWQEPLSKKTPYSEGINELLSAYRSREPFQYKAEDDPIYQQYAKSYGEAGRRAMQDTLAQVSSRTGGLASSYAGQAAQQSYNGYMQQLSDKVPELYKMALERYLREGEQMRDDIGLLRGLDSDAYGRASDDWNRRYQLGRTAVEDSRYEDETAYSRGRDALSDRRYEDETAYARGRDAKSDEEAEFERRYRLAALGQSVGDLSGLRGLGITPDTNTMLRMALAGAGRTSPIGSGGTGGGSPGGSNTGTTPPGNEPKLSEEDVAQLKALFPDGLSADLWNQYTAAGIDPGQYGLTMRGVGMPETGNGTGLGKRAQQLYNSIASIRNGTHLAEFGNRINQAQKNGEISEKEADYLLSAVGY